VVLRVSIIIGCKLNVKVKDREKEREEKRAVSLQPVWTQEPKNLCKRDMWTIY
jgi:hypothetical protein